MHLRLFVQDENAASAVIGVILMVAVTVILAAVIGTFVLGIGSQVSGDTPKVSIGFVFDGHESVTMTHRGGDDLNREEITVNVDGQNVGPTSDCYETKWPTDIGAGDKGKINDNLPAPCSLTMDPDDVVKVVWNDPDEGATAILGEETVP